MDSGDRFGEDRKRYKKRRSGNIEIEVYFMSLSEERIRKIVAVFRIMFLSFGIVAALLLFAMLLFFSFLRDSQFLDPLPQLIVMTVTSFAIYMGLKRVRPWVVPVIVFLSSTAIIFGILSQTTGLSTVIARGVGFVLHVSTIYFFTRKEVKGYFKSRGTTIFSV